MRFRIAALVAAVLCATTLPAIGQEHLRFALDVGEKATETKFQQTLKFPQYFEQGTLTLDRTVSRRPIFDGSAAVHVTGAFFAGATFAFFNDTGNGTATAAVPHPFFFNQFRNTTGTVAQVRRQESTLHLQALWVAPTAGGIELTAFGGPSIFRTEQTLATGIALTLADEVYPYDALSFPELSTQNVKENVLGYNAGVGMTWWLGKPRPPAPPRRIRGVRRKLTLRYGLGVLITYSHGSKTFTPLGGQPVTIEAGGLQAGGGLRVNF